MNNNRTVLTESALKEMIAVAINEAMEDEGFWGNIRNAIGKGISQSYQQGGGIKDAWKAGKQQFQNLQQGDRNIKQYNNARQAQQKLLQQKQQLMQQLQDVENQLKQYSFGTGDNAYSRMSRDMKGGYRDAKGAAMAGMDANQWDRQQRQQAAQA